MQQCLSLIQSTINWHAGFMRNYLHISYVTMSATLTAKPHPIRTTNQLITSHLHTPAAFLHAASTCKQCCKVYCGQWCVRACVRACVSVCVCAHTRTDCACAGCTLTSALSCPHRQRVHRSVTRCRLHTTSKWTCRCAVVICCCCCCGGGAAAGKKRSEKKTLHPEGRALRKELHGGPETPCSPTIHCCCCCCWWWVAHC